MDGDKGKAPELKAPAKAPAYGVYNQPGDSMGYPIGSQSYRFNRTDGGNVNVTTDVKTSRSGDADI